MFSGLARAHHLQNAALLLRDVTGEAFVLWASKGIDTTTKHRMRPSADFLAHYPPLREGRGVELDAGSLAPFRGYFSSRQFAVLERLTIIPFVLSNEIIAVLAVVRFETDGDVLPFRLDSIESSAAKLADRLSASRNLVLEPAGVDETGDARTRLVQIFGDAASVGTFVNVARINVEKLAADLVGVRPDAKNGRLKRDMEAAFARMVSGGGALLNLGGGEILLVVRSKQPYSEKLVIHQIGAVVRSLFREPPNLENFAGRVWTFPSGAETPEQMAVAIVG